MDDVKKDRSTSNLDAETTHSSPECTRTEEHSAVNVTKDKEFWFNDGTVILVAQDVEFCIYKGILAEHSPVFSDMFSLPQPAKEQSNNGAIEGPRCPVVHLSDSPYDLRHVLRKYLPRRGTEYVTDPSLNH